MKLWIDDIRPSPEGYKWIQSVDEFIWWFEHRSESDELSQIELIDLDHDSGIWNNYGGDYIKIIDYLEFKGMNNHSITFKIHSMNPVGRMNMERAILKHPKWKLER